MTTDINLRIATAVRIELARRNLPALALAPILGVSKQSISRKVNAATAFRVDELMTIARAWCIPLSTLLDAELVEAVATA